MVSTFDFDSDSLGSSPSEAYSFCNCNRTTRLDRILGQPDLHKTHDTVRADGIVGIRHRRAIDHEGE